jgi:hypothetical protein
VTPATLVEHRERLANAGRGTQIQAELTPSHANSVPLGRRSARNRLRTSQQERENRP